jgi:hypothetical protein
MRRNQSSVFNLRPPVTAKPSRSQYASVWSDAGSGGVLTSRRFQLDDVVGDPLVRTAAGFGRLAGGIPVASQHALQACMQLARIEGLGQVIVRTDFQTDDAVDRFTRTGHHDDADIEMFAQMARQAQPNWSVWW